MSVRPTRRGIAFGCLSLLFLILAGAMSIPGFLYASGLLLSLVLVGAVFVGLGHRKIDVQRKASPLVVEPGQRSTVTLTVTNQSALPAPSATWSESLPRTVAGRASGLFAPLASAGRPDDHVVAEYSVSTSTRGVHQLGPLSLQVSDPFAVVQREISVSQTSQFVVLPHRFALDPIRPRGGSADGSTRPAPQHVGVGEEDVIARRYLPGDAMKRLHWKATAHRGELMVRQEEKHLNPRAAVIVDLDSATHGTALHRGSWEFSAGLEWAISATASITTHLVGQGYAVSLTSHDGAIDEVIAEGEGSVRDSMVALAHANPSAAPIVTPVHESLVVLVTGHLDVRRAAEWRKHLAGDTTVMTLIAASSANSVVDDLDDSGWSVAVYHPRSDIPDVWRELDGSRSYVAR